MLVIARYLCNLPKPHSGHVHGLVLGRSMRFTVDSLGQYADAIQQECKGLDIGNCACLTVSYDEDASNDRTIELLIEVGPFLKAVRAGCGYVGPLVDGFPL